MSELTQDDAVQNDNNSKNIENVDKTATVAKSSHKMPRSRKKGLLMATLLFVMVGVAWAVLHVLFWQHEEETDDAYVSGNMIQVTPQITGTVSEVNVEDTDIVKAGQTVVVLDGSDAQLIFERARNQLIKTVRGMEEQGANLQQATADIALQKSQLAKAQADLQRRLSLQGTDAISSEEISHAKAAVDIAQAAVTASSAKAQAIRASLGHEAVADKPEVKSAITQFKDAWLNVQRTQIKAPEAGQIARRNVQVGQKINAGSPLMAVVPLHNLWVDANFKEVQIAKMRIGQPVSMVADVYGKKVVYHGKVQGLSAGTGSAFSLLPAQNATGNWIKVVQRVPVRIQLDNKELAQHPLRIGLSMKVTVDTQNQQGQSVAAATAAKPSEKAASLNHDLQAADQLVTEILQQYAPQ